jgi:chromosome segregation ATPase
MFALHARVRTLPPVRSRFRLLLLTAAVAVGLSGCASDEGDEVEELRAELISRSEAEEQLATRLDRLEEELEALGAATADDPTATRLDSLEDHLDRLDATLGVLDDRVEDEGAARRASAEEAEAAAAELRSTLVDIQGTLDELRAETDELRTLYETLRDRLDRQQRG